MATESYEGSAPLNTSGITTVNFTAPLYNDGGINTAAGSNTTINANAYGEGDTNVNLGAGSITTVNGSMGAAGLDIKGAPGSLLINNGTIAGGGYFNLTDATVVGNGTFKFGPWHDNPGGGSISGFFGSGLTFIAGGDLTISDPRSFFAKIDDTAQYPFATVTFGGLTADSYDFKNDFLTLYNGNTEVYQVRMNAPTSPYVVQDTRLGVSVIGDLYGQNNLTGIPQHTAGV